MGNPYWSIIRRVGTWQCYQLYHSVLSIEVFSNVVEAECSLPTTDLCAVGAVYYLEMEGRKVEL